MLRRDEAAPRPWPGPVRGRPGHVVRVEARRTGTAGLLVLLGPPPAGSAQLPLRNSPVRVRPAPARLRARWPLVPCPAGSRRLGNPPKRAPRARPFAMPVAPRPRPREGPVRSAAAEPRTGTPPGGRDRRGGNGEARAPPGRGALFCVRARARAAPRSAAGWPLRGNTGRRLLAPRSRPHSRPPAPPALTLGPQSESAVQNGGAPRRIGGDGTPGLDRPLGARWIPGRDLRSAERFTTTWELRTREREKARERESDGERERERERERAAAVVVGGGLEARRIPARRPPSLRLGRSARNPRRPLCYPRRPLRIGGRHGGAHRWP